MSDSEFTNSSGGLSRRENERPTPINLSKSLISQQIGYSVECTRKSNFRKAQIDFLPSPLGEGKKKAAFTLAEVLITLGIIGVVAAMTLPTLISNYQKHVWVNQLKKSVSVLSQGFTTMMGQDGVTELKDTYAFSGIGTGSCFQTDILTERCRSMKEGLERVFSGIQFAPCDGIQMKSLNGSDAGTRSSTDTCIMFPDGLELFNYRIYSSFIDGISFDVNGPKNPNTYGRDIFDLYIDRRGVLLAPSSYADAERSSNGRPDRLNYYYWRTATYEIYTCKSDGVSFGFGCAARVLEEDAMNY